MERIDLRIQQLSRLYELYDRFIGATEFVCHRGCSVCCTCNVTLTSLEVDYIRYRLGPRGTELVMERVTNNLSPQRFQPGTTLNGFARACMEGCEMQDEENDPGWGSCPLLSNGMCTIYPVRPFGCRSLNSMEDCAVNGAAIISPFTLTVNNVFMQYIEHMDCNGVSGNLSDMFLVLAGDNLPVFPITIKNQRLEGVMVPPEHRQRVGPLLQEIMAVGSR
ncbi:MAG: hypothetical protein RBR67_02760 [Desulfobacterium sp.]|nr:hypothetical protein [Desulfobacterium sp.]